MPASVIEDEGDFHPSFMRLFWTFFPSILAKGFWRI